MKSPLIHSDALDAAEAVIKETAGKPVILVRERIAKALMDVDADAREQSKADAAILADVLELLHEVSEYADNNADVIDGPGGEDGADLRPNRAMRWQIALDGTDYTTGLLARVEKAYYALRPEAEPLAGVEARINASVEYDAMPPRGSL